MELTIDQALQLGVTAHNAGNLQEAERLYRYILQVLPTHADANHNLGLISIYVNNAEGALPLFKTALEANPRIEQFWFSYIDALVKESQITNAKRYIKKAKKKGFDSKKLEALLSHSNVPAVSEVPSQAQLISLLGHYQNGQYEDAERSALLLTNQFPRHNFSWKILGAVLKNTGRLSEAVVAGRKAVEISPEDAEAHYNFGNTLKELGRLEESEVSYRQAIALQPDYSDAYYNLGGMLQELGRFEEAEASYRSAIMLKGDFAESHCNLGNTLQELGRLEEAEASYRQSIVLKSDYAEAHSNLGNALKIVGRLKEAETSLRRAIALKPEFSEARYNLGTLLFECGEYNAAAEQFTLIDIHQSKSYAIKCSYMEDKESVFCEKLDFLINQGQVNAVIGSLSCCSEIRYGIKRSNPFCADPLEYVVNTQLNGRYDFEKVFIKTAKDVLMDNSVSLKAQGLLTNGVQTAGNIFALGKVSRTEIENIIRAEIEKYRVYFKDSEEGFIENWPSSYNLRGWLVSMQSGGKLAAHMHDNGWISGSVYINVPSKPKTDSGKLVLCLGDQEHVSGAERNQEIIIDVVTGSLCLFPSSLHHYTVPFEEKEKRIVLAFDLIPIE